MKNNNLNKIKWIKISNLKKHLPLVISSCVVGVSFIVAASYAISVNVMKNNLESQRNSIKSIASKYENIDFKKGILLNSVTRTGNQITVNKKVLEAFPNKVVGIYEINSANKNADIFQFSIVKKVGNNLVNLLQDNVVIQKEHTENNIDLIFSNLNSGSKYFVFVQDEPFDSKDDIYGEIILHPLGVA